MQEFIYNHITLCIALPTLVIGTFITVYTLWLAYKSDKQLYDFCANKTFWKYATDFDNIFIRWLTSILIAFAIFGTIEVIMCMNYKCTLIEQHKNAPCSQCQYKKCENIWHDKRGIEHKETQLIWQRCPTIKL